MTNLKFTLKLTFTCAWLVCLICKTELAQSVEIECIPLKSCPTVMRLIFTKKYAPETIEFLKRSHCGFDERRQPKVWCAKFNFCTTPDNRNGTCTPLKKCKSFLQLRATLGTSSLIVENYLNQFRCNTILKEVHVCCRKELPVIPEYLDRRVPDIRDRFSDSDYDDGNTNCGWLSDEPVYHNNHQDHSVGDIFHRDIHPPSSVNGHGPWNINNRHDNDDAWNIHNHIHHHHGLDYGERWNMHRHVDGFENRNSPKYENKPKNNGRRTGHDVFDNSGRNNHQAPHNHNKHHTGSREPSTSERDSKTHEQITPTFRDKDTKRIDNFDHTTRRGGSKTQEVTTSNSRHISKTHKDGFDSTTIGSGWKTQKQTTSSSRDRSSTIKYGFEDTTRKSVLQSQTTPVNSDEGRVIYQDSINESSRNTPEQTTKRANGDARRNDLNNKTCETPERKAGICTKQNNCQPYLKLQNNLDKSKKTITDYLNKFRCNSTNTRDIYVCCEKDEEKDIDNTVFNVERTLENAPDSKICGRQTANTDKIFGGTSAALGEFPWIALLQYPSNSGLMSGCGGSLINSRYVLTAAHCVDADILKSRRLQPLRQVILGEYDTRNATDCIYMQYGVDCADPPKVYGVESILSHNLYTSGTTRHDIALVRLNEEVIYTDYIRPICLPPKTSTLNGNETFVIAGWGRTPTETSSPVLKKAKIPFAQKENCNARNTNSRSLIEGQICAGRQNSTDSCNGDSGGPVMLEVNFNFEFVTHLVGIISYGFGECGNGPSVSTFVPYYIDWINDNIR